MQKLMSFSAILLIALYTNISSAGDELRINTAQYFENRNELKIEGISQGRNVRTVQLINTATGAVIDEQTIRTPHFKFRVDTSTLSTLPCEVSVLVGSLSESSTVRNADGCGVYSTTISGQVTDQPIPYATVTATVNGQVFTTVADANGYYNLNIQTTSLSSLVTLLASGTTPDGSDIVEFFSLPGSFESLAEESQTNITNVTTALYSLLVVGNGGTAPTTELELQAAETTVDTSKLLELATLIKVIVDEPGYDLPENTSFLDLISDPALSEAYMSDISANAPTLFETTQAAILTDSQLTQGFQTAEANGKFITVNAANAGYIARAGLVYNFDEATGRGNIIGKGLLGGSNEIPFSFVVENGTILITYDQPITSVAYASDLSLYTDDQTLLDAYNASSSQNEQFEVLDTSTQIRLIRVDDGSGVDNIVLEYISHQTVPSFVSGGGVTVPELSRTRSGLDMALLYQSNFDSGLAFETNCTDTPTCVHGIWGGVYSYSPGVRSYDDYVYPRLNYGEVIQFSDDGTSVGVISGVVTNWSVDENGTLIINYADGTTQVSTPITSNNIELGVVSEYSGGSEGNFASYDIWVRGDANFTLDQSYLNSQTGKYWNGEVNAWIPGLLDDSGSPVPDQRFGWKFDNQNLSNYSSAYDYSTNPAVAYFIEVLTHGWQPTTNGIEITRYSFAKRYWIPITSTMNGDDRQFYVIEFERRDAQLWYGGTPGFREFIVPRLNIQREIDEFTDWPYSFTQGPF